MKNVPGIFAGNYLAVFVRMGQHKKQWPKREPVTPGMKTVTYKPLINP
jgi:hypothetical protein